MVASWACVEGRGRCWRRDCGMRLCVVVLGGRDPSFMARIKT